MTKKPQLTNSKRPAFTLVELLVALSIILLMITAAVSIETRYIKMASQIKHQLQAYNFAESRLNLVRQIRDTNILTNNPNVFNEIEMNNCPAGTGCWLWQDKDTLQWHLSPTTTINCNTTSGLCADQSNINNTNYTIKVFVE